jgi:hypothetical protein
VECETTRNEKLTLEERYDRDAGIYSQQCSSSDPDDVELREQQNETIGSVKIEIDGLDLRKCSLKGKQKRRLIELLNRFKDVFSKDGEPGLITDVEFFIDTGNAAPFKDKSRYLSPKKFVALRKILDKMVKDGIIRPSNSDWASAIVMVPKDGGTTWRLCIDYRRLNALTKSDAYPLPRMQDLVTCYKDAETFSSLDLTAGYWQIPVALESIAKTAFVCPLGLYEFIGMPFGPKGAPACFQRCMDDILQGLQWSQAPTYVDNIGVWSKKGQSHLAILEQVLQRMRNRGAKLNPRKCEIGQSQVTYLGHLIDNQGMRLSPERIKAISDYPTPTNLKQLRRFLGMASWCRNFVEGFANIAAPLTSLQKLNTAWQWTTVEQAAFDTLKNKLQDSSVVTIFDPLKPITVQTDASKDGLGAVLLQPDERGKWQPIEYASRKTTDSESNYASTELECLALVWAVDRWADYLQGQEFLVRTDNAALKWLMGKANLKGRLARWVMCLQTFQFTIEHCSGKDNQLADALSRVHSKDDEEEEGTMESHVPKDDVSPGVTPAALLHAEQHEEQDMFMPEYPVPTNEISDENAVISETVPTPTKPNGCVMTVIAEIHEAPHDMPNSPYPDGGFESDVSSIHSDSSDNPVMGSDYWFGPMEVRESVKACETRSRKTKRKISQREVERRHDRQNVVPLVTNLHDLFLEEQAGRILSCLQNLHQR